MTLLLGNSETGLTAEKTVAKGHAAGFAFTASETGLLEELQIRTNANANTGVTSVRLAVFAEGAEVPENAIQEGVFTGTPGTNIWIAVTGLAIPILKNAKYWLVVMPIGGTLHFNIHGAGGSTKWRSTSSEKSNLYEVGATEWGASATEGPMGFQGLGRAGVGTERKVLFGINAGNTNHGHTAWVSNRVCLGRGVPGLDAEYSTTTPTEVSTAVGEALAVGITPIVIINASDEVVLSSIVPSTYAEKAVAIIKKVIEQHPAVRTFEILNEPYLKGPHHKSNAADYANILLATYEKLAAEGIVEVTLLASAAGTYEKVDASGVGTGEFSDVHSGGGWVHDLLATKPQLKAGGTFPITGWTSHPYGKPTEIGNEFNSGFLVSIALRESVKRNGGSGYNNWWITEVGVNIEGISEAEQSTRLQEDLEQAQLMGEAGWLKALVVYDDSETEPWNVYGKAAGTMYQSFASEHGLVPPALWIEATKTWEEVAVGVTWENVQRGEV